MEKKRIQEGPPIWVESLMTAEEWKARYKSGLESSTVPEPIQYDPNRHRGGKWRAGMGPALTPEEIKIFNKGIDQLRELLKTKAFQKKPDYGPHAEAKP